MNRVEWCRKWHVPIEALDELFDELLFIPDTAPNTTPLSEAGVASRVRLEASKKRIHLWRNNVGAGKLDNGSFIRWGLANDSKQLNDVLKSADWVGVKPRTITHADVGSVIGQFISREIKRSNWKFSGSIEEVAQMRWALLVNSCGGDAKIVTDIGSL